MRQSLRVCAPIGRVTTHCILCADSSSPPAAGTSIALLGTYLYTEATKKFKPAPASPASPPPKVA